ncbi:MAG: hypothetical protein ACYCSR_06020 [Thiomonas sp.]
MNSAEKWASFDAARTASLFEIGERLRLAREAQVHLQADFARARTTVLDPFSSPKARAAAIQTQVAAVAGGPQAAETVRVLEAEQSAALRGDHPAMVALRLSAQLSERAEHVATAGRADAALRDVMHSFGVQAALGGAEGATGRVKALERAAEFLGAS